MYRIGEVHIFTLHDETEDIAALAAAETVVILTVFIDCKRWRFFLMKGTQCLVNTVAAALQMHIRTKQVNNIDP